MAMECLKGIIYLSLAFFCYCFIGMLYKKNDNSYKKIIYGYILFTCVISFGGLITQFLQLSVKVFYLYYLFILFLIVVNFIIYCKKNELGKISLLEIVKRYYFIVFIAFVLLGLCLAHVNLQWLANHLDDGRYLNLAANYSKVSNPYLTDIATGLPCDFSFIRALNTFELETSFWIWLLRSESTFFVRIFVNLHNYLILLNSICFFVCELKENMTKSWIQYAALPIVLFMLTTGEHFTHFIILQDDWQFASAMWYGSSIVRMAGLFILFGMFINKNINVHSIIELIIVSIILMTRASQALPMILVFCFSFLLLDLWKKNKIYWFIGIVGLGILFGVVYQAMGQYQGLNIIPQSYLDNNKHSYLLYLSVIMLMVMLVLNFKNKNIRKTYFLILFLILFMFVPVLNSLFLASGQYTFVIGRTLTSLTVFVVIFVWSEFIIFVDEYLKVRGIEFILKVGCCIFTIGWSFLVFVYGTTPIGSYKSQISTLKNNVNIAPNALLNCSEELEKITNSNNPLVVLSPEFVYEDDYLTPIASLLRIKAPNIINLSAKPRYPDCVQENLFYSYSDDDQALVNDFLNENNSYDSVSELIEKYQVTALLTTNENSKNELIENGFELEYQYSSNSNNYYICIKE